MPEKPLEVLIFHIKNSQANATPIPIPSDQKQQQMEAMLRKVGATAILQQFNEKYASGEGKITDKITSSSVKEYVQENMPSDTLLGSRNLEDKTALSLRRSLQLTVPDQTYHLKNVEIGIEGARVEGYNSRAIGLTFRDGPEDQQLSTTKEKVFLIKESSLTEFRRVNRQIQKELRRYAKDAQFSEKKVFTQTQTIRAVISSGIVGLILGVAGDETKGEIENLITHFIQNPPQLPHFPFF